jgi:hypothetical protein
MISTAMRSCPVVNRLRPADGLPFTRHWKPQVRAGRNGQGVLMP